jgi:hypothetical protein
MIATMLAPEYILGKAVGDLAAAWQCRERMRVFAKEDNVEWGLAHGFYANMGGFVGVFEDELQGKEGQGNEAMAEPVTLTAKSIYWLRKAERQTDMTVMEAVPIESRNKKMKIERLPDITTAELHDKSKGDIFVKTIAVVQVFWAILQIIIRATKGLSISQLELAVVAFSACAIITYILLIPKPQGVRVPSRPIRCEPQSISELDETGGILLRVYFIPDAIGDMSQERDRIPNDFLSFGFDVDGGFEDGSIIHKSCLYGFILGSIIFGSIHVAGWNLPFPTLVEQILWRISSILITVLLPIVFIPILVFYRNRIYNNLPIIITNVNNVYIIQTCNLIFGTLYIAARLFLLVEIFRTLLYLPADAYISTWASNVPHVA